MVGGILMSLLVRLRTKQQHSPLVDDMNTLHKVQSEQNFIN
jgi:hypothetical protein